MQEQIKNITLRIVKQFKPRRLVLFGSAAAGETGPDSDIDLCVIEDRVSDKVGEIIKIRRILGNINIPIDFLVFGREEFERRKDIWGTVQYEIDKKGIILYERRD